MLWQLRNTLTTRREPAMSEVEVAKRALLAHCDQSTTTPNTPRAATSKLREKRPAVAGASFQTKNVLETVKKPAKQTVSRSEQQCIFAKSLTELLVPSAHLPKP